ncbi:hypothetical protein Ahy_A03g013312 isoform C [Arachis hypogaea]|uniref:Uncharacterized protein n=1 Tax=Arachis hypogaea TaxID=3818 RepID=A0A445DVD8_ARAHY|nr:hypothetical protein Ahy_A03g013312 isoform C [Arachis hypogaea]
MLWFMVMVHSKVGKLSALLQNGSRIQRNSVHCKAQSFASVIIAARAILLYECHMHRCDYGPSTEKM